MTDDELGTVKITREKIIKRLSKLGLYELYPGIHEEVGWKLEKMWEDLIDIFTCLLNLGETFVDWKMAGITI